MTDFLPIESKYQISQNIIYKYVSLYTAEIIIATSTLKFSNPKDFNDPFDCDENILEFNIKEKGSYVEDDISKLAQRIYQKDPALFEKLGVFIERIKKDIEGDTKLIDGYKKRIMQAAIDISNVCCFSKTYKNSLMWSHYSDKHKGVCLAFKLMPNTDNIFSNKVVDIIGQVDYERISKINYLKDKIQAICKLFLSKHNDWKYEEEVRIIIRNEKGLVKFNKDFLSGIIFGCRVTNVQIEEMKNLCNRHEYQGLDFVRAKKADFELEFEHI